MGFDDSGNFYILTDYQNGPDGASSGSGALVLQKYDFTGNTPSPVAFTSDQTTRISLRSAFGAGRRP